MANISVPSTVTYQATKKTNVGTLVVEPLYPGYGTTIGNALRRVLLSSLPGAAVTSLKIAGISHEFTAVPKVQEDVLQIIMNLKQLRLKVFSDEPVKLHFSAKGEKVITAADIEKNSNVEIANPDLVIATLTSKDAVLEMDIWVSKGRGYETTESRVKESNEVGRIVIDSFYSPVKRVAFNIESARVGQMTNYDKLVMEIETDGTITGEEAVKSATEVLVEHFVAIGQFGDPVEDAPEADQVETGDSEEMSNKAESEESENENTDEVSSEEETPKKKVASAKKDS